jgi:hypothetical protein
MEQLGVGFELRAAVEAIGTLLFLGVVISPVLLLVYLITSRIPGTWAAEIRPSVEAAATRLRVYLNRTK